jgi:predicted ArsR family transcriptional regulator
VVDHTLSIGWRSAVELGKMGLVKNARSHPSAPADDGDRGTRQRLSRLIGTQGPVTVAALAGQLSLTTAAVRRHLDAMLDDGLIEGREVPGSAPRRRGRPARAFVLSAAGHARLTSGYDDLAAQGGRAAVASFARHRGEELVSRLTPLIGAGGPAARADRLAEALSAEGFAATTRPIGGDAGGSAAVQLCQGHCPVQRVAADYPELCDAETDAIARLLGVDVRRLATLARGDHVCTTHIPVSAPDDRRPVPSPDAPTVRSSR